MGLALAHSADNNTSPPNNDRVALRAAIARRDAASREMDALKAAQSRASDMVDAAEKKLETARAAIEKAQEQQAAGMLEAATTGKPLKSGGAIRIARDAEREALDELEAARATLAKIAARLDFPRHGVTGASTDPVTKASDLIARAADEVIRNAVRVDGRVQRAGQLLADLHRVRTELASLLHDGLARTEDHQAITEALAPILLPSIKTFGGSPNIYAFDAASSPWADVREALMRDPDADIPE